MIRRQQQRPRIQRRWIIIGVVVLALFISISSIVRFYTDVLWFGELGFTNVFWKILWTRFGVGAVGGIGAGIIVLANLEVARRAAPTFRFVATGGDITEQYRTAFRPYARLANIVIAAVVAFFTGLSTSGAWDRILLWRNARPFGIRAPAPFGHDVSFYVFSIPVQRTILSWLFGVLIVSLLLAAVAHLLNGSIQPETNRVNIATVVKVHVSALLGVIALLKAWAYRLDVFELVFSGRGVVTGASYTDVHAQRPALRVLMVIAVVVAVILFVNVFRFQGWLLPGAALALWVFSSVLLGAIIPAAVQRFQVVPNESVRERPFIARNIEATRRAFDMDRINVRDFRPRESLDAETVKANRGTIDNVRVWDPSALHPTYQRLQAIRTYYEFDDIDIDRYMIDGRLRQVMLAPREVDPSKLDARAQNWVNTHLTYTHGYGTVANASNAVTSEGLPNFLVRDLPPKGRSELIPDEGAVYFGERMTGYSVVKTKQREIDYPKGDQAVQTTTYEGKGGIELSNLTRRLAFAMRFGDTDLLLSRFITKESRVIMRRNIIERVRMAAPFLRYDADPYIVVADGKLHWVIDAYTVSDRFPYSDRLDITELFGSQGNLRGDVNYIRNSVKVVIDAFDGTTKFYVADPSDALISTYQAAFPTLFTPIDKMPKAIREHLRYPEDMFMVQAWQYRLYHIKEAEQFYAREDAWDVPVDPVQSSGQAKVVMKPYYVVMKLPWEDKEEFLLMLPFTPRERPTLNGWIAARMDGERYGEMVELSFPRGVSIDSPQNISAKINQNDKISQQFTLWEGAGSRVIHGPIYVIPIERTLVYVQPIYLRAEDEERALPELRRVIVVIGNKIGFEPTLEGALSAALSGKALTIEEQEAAGRPEAPSGNVAELLQQAVEHFRRADEALRNGDLATYQRENEAGRKAVEEAQQQSG
jgi:hypothetical protein